MEYQIVIFYIKTQQAVNFSKKFASPSQNLPLVSHVFYVLHRKISHFYSTIPLQAVKFIQNFVRNNL